MPIALTACEWTVQRAIAVACSAAQDDVTTKERDDIVEELAGETVRGHAARRSWSSPRAKVTIMSERLLAFMRSTSVSRQGS